MSEHDERAVPCAWCEKEPTLLKPNSVGAECGKDCLNHGANYYDVEEWNSDQRRIRAMREADFEAGWRRAEEHMREPLPWDAELCSEAFADYLASKQLRSDIAEGIKDLDEGRKSELSAEEIKAEGRRILASKQATREGER